MVLGGFPFLGGGGTTVFMSKFFCRDGPDWPDFGAGTTVFMSRIFCRGGKGGGASFLGGSGGGAASPNLCLFFFSLGFDILSFYFDVEDLFCGIV